MNYLILTGCVKKYTILSCEVRKTYESIYMNLFRKKTANLNIHTPDFFPKINEVQEKSICKNDKCFDAFMNYLTLTGFQNIF